MLVSLLAIGLTNPINQDFLRSMYSWPRTAREYGGYSVVNSYYGSLHTYIQAHCFFDFAKLGKDNPTLTGSKAEPIDWWLNSVNAAYANRQFCIDNAATYSAYGADSWGISQWNGMLGAAPCECNSGNPYQDGSIASYGAISCIPLMRTSASEALDNNLSFKALRNYYQKYYYHLWGAYGPRDFFNGSYYPTLFSHNYFGINMGPEVLMIENYRSGFVWNNFMKNEKVKVAVSRVFGDISLPDPHTIYVNVANTDDLSQDGSAEHPFDTIQKAVDIADYNSVIQIAPGRYLETIQIPGRGKVTLKGIIGDRDNPTDPTKNSVIENSAGGYSITMSESTGVTIDSVVITGVSNNSICTAGILVSTCEAVNIRNTIIQGLAGYGGAITLSDSNNVTISDNKLAHNGGAAWPGGAGGINAFFRATICTNVTIANNDIVSNHGWPTGGGLYIMGDGVSIRNNLIYDNDASEWGGGLVLGGGHIEVSNNIIASNHTSGGYYPDQGAGGMLCSADGTIITNNVFDGNSRHNIYISANDVKVNNNVMLANWAINFFGNSSTSLTYNNAYNPTGYYANYENCTPGMGSISENPLFANPDTGDGDPYNDDYHLQSGSSCIDSGDPDVAYNDKDCTRNDMGVYGGPNSM